MLLQIRIEADGYLILNDDMPNGWEPELVSSKTQRAILRGIRTAIDQETKKDGEQHQQIHINRMEVYIALMDGICQQYRTAKNVVS